MAHAALGCAVGAVGTGNCEAGAAGQLAGEISGILYDGATQEDIDYLTQEWKNRGIDISRLSGAFAAAIAGGDADDVSLGSNAGGTAAANNALFVPLLIALAFTSATYTAVDVANVYLEEGAEAAVKQLAINGAVTLIAGGAFKVGGIIYKNADDAYHAWKATQPATSSARLLTAKQANDIHHIFNKEDHQMDDFRALFNSDKEALLAIEDAAQNAYEKGF